MKSKFVLYRKKGWFDRPIAIAHDNSVEVLKSAAFDDINYCNEQGLDPYDHIYYIRRNISSTLFNVLLGTLILFTLVGAYGLIAWMWRGIVHGDDLYAVHAAVGLISMFCATIIIVVLDKLKIF